MKLNVFLLVAMVVAACGCSGSSDTNESRNIEVVELEHSEIWSKGNLGLVETVYSEDFVGHFPAGTVRGHAGIRASVESHRTSFPDWTEVVEDIIADGDRVVSRFTSRGTNLGEFLGKPATGNRVEATEVCVRHFIDGKIAELWVYPDIISMQRQLNSGAPEPFTEPQSISFVGLADEHMGVASWNADGSGKEPAREHPALTTPVGEIRHHYYGSSPDYDGIDPESPGGLRATKAVCGFTHFMAAIRKEGYSISDLVANVPLYTPTEDTTGWSYENDIEKRYMQSHGPTVFRLRGESLFQVPAARSVSLADWGVDKFPDVRFWGYTEPSTAEDISQSSSEAIQRIAQAFLKDVGSQRLCFVMDALVLRHDLAFSGNGRVGGMIVEVTSSRLEVVP